MLSLTKHSMKRILTESMRNVNKQFVYLNEKIFRVLTGMISGMFKWLSEYGDTALDVLMSHRQYAICYFITVRNAFTPVLSLPFYISDFSFVYFVLLWGFFFFFKF